MKINLELLFIPIILLILIFGFIFNIYCILQSDNSRFENAILIGITFIGIVFIPLSMLWLMIPDDKFGCVE